MYVKEVAGKQCDGEVTPVIVKEMPGTAFVDGRNGIGCVSWNDCCYNNHVHITDRMHTHTQCQPVPCRLLVPSAWILPSRRQRKTELPGLHAQVPNDCNVTPGHKHTLSNAHPLDENSHSKWVYSNIIVIPIHYTMTLYLYPVVVVQKLCDVTVTRWHSQGPLLRQRIPIQLSTTVIGYACMTMCYSETSSNTPPFSNVWFTDYEW